jgi:hypothetical protein
VHAPDWLERARALPEGTTRKVPHDCGPGDCLQVNHKPDGFSAYCHRCEYRGWFPRPAESLAERLERVSRAKAVERRVEATLDLPNPRVLDPREWPSDARVWLYKAGVSNAEIEALGFYWNPSLQRVVMPVRGQDGKPIYWQARTLDKTNPRKYINPRADKSRLVARYGSGPLVVLTEDLLSAYKVATRGNVAGWCLMGTKLSEYVAGELLRGRKPVAVWLDPDGAGQTAAAKIMRALRAYGLDVRNVVSNKDPKLLSREEINETCRRSYAR